MSKWQFLDSGTLFEKSTFRIKLKNIFIYENR